jgi:hypothetical protein
VLEAPLSPTVSLDAPRPDGLQRTMFGWGGTGRLQKVLFGAGAAAAELVCQLRGLTVMLFVSGVAIPETVTLTVPLVTITPDHVRLAVFVLRWTELLLLSVNVQLDTLILDGLTAQLTDPPRVTEEGVQAKKATFAGPAPSTGRRAHRPVPSSSRALK